MATRRMTPSGDDDEFSKGLMGHQMGPKTRRESPFLWRIIICPCFFLLNLADFSKIPFSILFRHPNRLVVQYIAFADQ